MNDEELELFTAVGNCYQTCKENYEETLKMISGWRGYTTQDAHNILVEVKKKYGATDDYQKLRGRFPKDFPI